MYHTINESKEELDKILLNEKLTNVNILILGNKIDNPISLSEEEFKHYLGLSNINRKNLKVLMCSVKKNYNINSGLNWLEQQII